jgi:hypothetical protein
MIGFVIAVVAAALAYAACIAFDLPSIVALTAAILVLVALVPSRGFGVGRRGSGGSRA